MIFYFSGTGNSLYTARKLSETSNDSMISIADALKTNKFSYTLSEGERVGFVFPVYYWGLPTIVTEFISKLQLNNYKDNYTYSVITCGANIGNAMKVLTARLVDRSYHLDSCFSLAMPDNYIIMYDVISPEAQDLKLKAADGELGKIANSISAKERKIFKVVKGSFPALMTSGVHFLYKYGRKTKKFHTTEACTGCGMCAKICPTATIRMKDNKPVWGSECTQCLACINRCPVKAIQYGKGTYKRGRYVNPNAYRVIHQDQ